MLLSRFFALVLVGLLTATVVTPVLSQTASEDCEVRAREAQVVRADARSMRLFVIATESDLLETAPRARVLQTLQSLVEDCQPGWEQDWRISFFSNPASAGYKDEPALSEQVTSGQWAEAYIGEFEMSERKLTVFPAVPARSKWFVDE
jgi:hypothetical protein